MWPVRYILFGLKVSHDEKKYCEYWRSLFNFSFHNKPKTLRRQKKGEEEKVENNERRTGFLRLKAEKKPQSQCVHIDELEPATTTKKTFNIREFFAEQALSTPARELQKKFHFNIRFICISFFIFLLLLFARRWSHSLVSFASFHQPKEKLLKKVEIKQQHQIK